MSKKSLKKQPVDINEWLEDYSAFMADEAIKLLKAQGKKKGDIEYKALVTLFLYRIMTQLLIETLHERPDGLDEEGAYNFSRKAYGDVKYQLQESVAMAFTTAMGHFYGKPVEFYCQVKPIPEMGSSLSN